MCLRKCKAGHARSEAATSEDTAHMQEDRLQINCGESSASGNSPIRQVEVA